MSTPIAGSGGGFRSDAALKRASRDRDLGELEVLLCPVGVTLREDAVCVAGGKVRVVKYPDLHMALLCLVENDVHVRPPLRAAEVGVRAALDAERADAAVVYLPYDLAQNGLALAVLPEEREKVVSVFAAQGFKNALFHNDLPE